MNKKVKTYILIVAVVGIWSTVAYKLVNGLNTSTPEIASVSTIESFKPQTIKTDTLSLTPIHRDPFLGTLVAKTVKKKASVVKTTKAVEIQVPVQYHGTISSKEDSKLYIISIAGSQYYAQIGQEIKGVTLLKGNESSIKVRYQKINKIIPRL